MTKLDLPPYPFPGPEPDMTKPDEHAVRKAELALRMALDAARNGEQKGITDKDAELLLKQMVYMQRSMLRDELFNGSDDAFRAANSALDPHCEEATYLSRATGLELADGLKEIDKQKGHIPLEGHQSIVTTWNSQDLRRRAPKIWGHSFAVVQLPVRTDEGVEKKSFLLDTTYRQFFDPEKKTVKYHRPMDGAFRDVDYVYPGHRITETADGRAVADTLLRQGYIRLDEKTAQAYLGSFTGIGNYEQDMQPNAATLIMQSPEGSYIPPCPKLKFVKRFPQTPLTAYLEKPLDTERQR